jgi:hypothetical protein
VLNNYVKKVGGFCIATTARQNSPVIFEAGIATIEDAANAKLIAAAPDLLIAAKGAIAALSQNKTFPADVEVAKSILRDAIKKAHIQGCK